MVIFDQDVAEREASYANIGRHLSGIKSRVWNGRGNSEASM